MCMRGAGREKVKSRASKRCKLEVRGLVQSLVLLQRVSELSGPTLSCRSNHANTPLA